MVKYKDYYATLGVSRQATEKEIKASYRKLAREYHPDANPDQKGAAEKFREITEAYEVLKDPEKRQRYDMLGSNWKAGSDFRPPPGFDTSGFTFDFGNLGDLGRGSAFSDFFEMMFGQSLKSGGGRHGSGETHPGADQEAEIELSVEDLARGSTRNIQITSPGMKVKTLEVKIPKGVRNGFRVRVPGHGIASRTGGKKGDLYLRVRVRPHPYYTVDGDNLISELNITPAQAVIGAQATVTTIDGPVKLEIKPLTQTGRLLRLRGKGLPRLKEEARGDHLVRVKISIPANPSPEEVELYTQLAALESTLAK